MESSTKTAETATAITDKITSEQEAKRAAFFASLSPKDQLIHTLATKMLKTRYTPERSNAWASWSKPK